MNLKTAPTDSSLVTNAPRQLGTRPIDIFSEMTEAELDVLSQMTHMKNYRRRELVYSHSDRGDVIYWLRKGRVKIYRLSPEGKELTLALLEPGEIFGEMALVDDGPRDAIAEALDDTHLCVIRISDFERLLRKKPSLAMRVTKLIGQRRRAIENQLEDLAFCNVPSRVARLLMSLAAKHGIHDSRGIILNLKLSQQELANLIGAVRETTSATLNEFKRLGVIDIQHRRIKILETGKLRKIANTTMKVQSLRQGEETNDFRGL